MIKKVELWLTSDQAEEIIVGLAMRSNQKRIKGTIQEKEIDVIGRELQVVFGKEFGWWNGVYDRHKFLK